jgi:uncharacterized protein (TIGR02145 family)
MKSLPFLMFLLLFSFSICAQDYLISFTGGLASLTVDSVRVRNLTQNTTLVLPGTDTLHLMVGGVGMENLTTEPNSMLVYPNPGQGYFTIEFDNADQGRVQLDLITVKGEPVNSIRAQFPAGHQTVMLQGLGVGCYLLHIQSKSTDYCQKIVSEGKGSRTDSPVFKLIRMDDTGSKKHSRLKSLVYMQYDEGDQLLLTGISGTYTTLVPLVPHQSQQVTFNFYECRETDSTNYPVVETGSRVWMAENLNVGTRIIGLTGQTNNQVIEKYCFDDLDQNCDIYGGLYQWNEVMDYLPAETKGICPDGWHIPTITEWTDLANMFGGLLPAGGKLKETGFSHWHSPNSEAVNSSGFTALPSGRHGADGHYYYLGYYGYYWASTEYSPNLSWANNLSYDQGNMNRSNYDKEDALAVRCILD